MTGVSNTTPLNYLVLIGRAEILKALYERVVIPPAVFTELTSIKAPDKVRAWTTSNPEWLAIEQTPNVIDSELDGTLGILTTAAEKGLITLSDAVDDLRQTSFRASDRLLELLVLEKRE